MRTRRSQPAVRPGTACLSASQHDDQAEEQQAESIHVTNPIQKFSQRNPGQNDRSSVCCRSLHREGQSGCETGPKGCEHDVRNRRSGQGRPVCRPHSMTIRPKSSKRSQFTLRIPSRNSARGTPDRTTGVACVAAACIAKASQDVKQARRGANTTFATGGQARDGLSVGLTA